MQAQRRVDEVRPELRAERSWRGPRAREAGSCSGFRVAYSVRTNNSPSSARILIKDELDEPSQPFVNQAVMSTRFRRRNLSPPCSMCCASTHSTCLARPRRQDRGPPSRAAGALRSRLATPRTRQCGVAKGGCGCCGGRPLPDPRRRLPASDPATFWPPLIVLLRRPAKATRGARAGRTVAPAATAARSQRRPSSCGGQRPRAAASVSSSVVTMHTAAENRQPHLHRSVALSAAVASAVDVPAIRTMRSPPPLLACLVSAPSPSHDQACE